MRLLQERAKARRAALRLASVSVLVLATSLGGTSAFAAEVEDASVKIDPENPDYGRQVDELVVTGSMHGGSRLI